MSEKILVADDSPTIQKVVGITLAKSNYELYYGKAKDQGLFFSATADQLIGSEGLQSNYYLPDIDGDEKIDRWQNFNCINFFSLVFSTTISVKVPPISADTLYIFVHTNICFLIDIKKMY